MDIKRFYVSASDIVGDRATLSGSEFYHLTKVLRYKVGYKLILCNNADGIDYYATLSEIGKDCAVAEIYDRVCNECRTKVAVTLYQALPKGDKADLIVQKAVELGAGSIVLFESEYVSETKFNLERLERINIEACKQCGRSRVAEIGGLLSFCDMLAELSRYDRVIVAYEREEEGNLRSQLTGGDIRSVALIIGSEGGFTDEEISKIRSCGGVPVTLGRRILRCETASIVALGLVMYELGEMAR